MKRILYLLVFTCLYCNAQSPITSTKMQLFGDHIFIQLSVDGSEPLDFIFDTGDGLPVIDLDVAQELGLDLDHAASKTSAQGAVKGALIDHNTIELNGIVLEKDIELYATSLRHLEMSIGKNIDGIIGYDLLHHYVVKLDYDQGMFELYDQPSYVHEGFGESFEFKLDNYIPHIEAQVTLNDGEVLSGEFFVNTGAGATLDFNTRFAAKNDIIERTGEHFSYPVAGLSNKETTHYEGRVRNFGFGTFDFEKMPIGISTAKHGIQHNKKVAGIIGNKLLKRFNITFDYSREKIYFVKNRNIDNAFSVNASGLNLQLSEDMSKVLVHKVYDASPAKLVGIVKDAEILRVNGKDIKAYALPELRDLLEQANKNIELTLWQEGEEQSFTLDLDQLI
ncbi:Aspartyl protease [Ekhidna lutea]|uniref:Aspartyl protease n=1 Tax=Ekhidna lutea TaxID=447679 RepID=A0A239M901_EKHLU|nr:retropepsin-like aspartic protease [Ekhidna lutea]SNT38454.1 Aspartyl protease [Ekhidna lutea]